MFSARLSAHSVSSEGLPCPRSSSDTVDLAIPASRASADTDIPRARRHLRRWADSGDRGWLSVIVRPCYITDCCSSYRSVIYLPSALLAIDMHPTSGAAGRYGVRGAGLLT